MKINFNILKWYCILCFIASLQWLAGVKVLQEDMEAGWAALMLMKKKIVSELLDDDNDGLVLINKLVAFLSKICVISKVLICLFHKYVLM